MEILISIFSFLVAVTVLVGFHELGHFAVARFFGVKVLVFSIGFGRPLLKKINVKTQTRFSIGSIPLGGYVKMLDEVDVIDPQEKKYAFGAKPASQKALIVMAGPIANFILTAALFFIIFLSGSISLQPIIGDLDKESIVYSAGIRAGDKIVNVNNRQVQDWSDLNWELIRNNKESLNLQIIRNGGEIRHYTVDLLDDERQSSWVERGIVAPVVDLLPVVGAISSDGTASKSDLKVGDKILSVNGGKIGTWSEFVNFVRSHPGDTAMLSVNRNSKILEFPLRIGISGDNVSVGKIGVGPDVENFGENDGLVFKPNRSFFDAFQKSIVRTLDMIVFTVNIICGLLVGSENFDNVAGPIAIADQAGKTASIGFVSFLTFLAILSISLGVINLFPLPLLDGGHLLFHLYELVIGKKLPERVIVKAQQVGLVVLVLLMAYILTNDFMGYLKN